MLGQNMKSIGNRWKYYYINSKEEKTIKNTIEKYPKNILDFIGFNLFKDNILVNPIKNQSGIISFFGMDNKALNQNQLNLIYLVLYNMLSELSTEKNIPNFLEKGDNLDLYKDVESKQDQNDVKDSDLFINQLKLLLKNRDKELTSQYYSNFGFDLNKKDQRIYEKNIKKNTKYSQVKSNINEQREDF